jgi:hypothetical protein
VWSENQKQLREDAKKIKFLTQDSEKVYCGDSMRQKKSEPSVCADETGRQKKKELRKRKVLRAQQRSDRTKKRFSMYTSC